MQISQLLNLMGQMFLLIVAGIVLKKKGILPEKGKAILTDLLLYFILPCNIITSFQIEFSMDVLGKLGILLICAVLIQVASFILSRILYNRQEHAVKKVLQYVTIVSNSGFIGLPVAGGVFGAEGLMYASIFIIPMRIMMWTAGIGCFTEESDVKSAIKKVAVHPCIIAVYIGLALMISQVQLPEFLAKTIKGAGGCTTTVSMLIIGMMLAEVDLKQLIDLQVVKVIFVRLVLLPVIALGIARVLGLSDILTGIAVILTAMPAGSTSAMLAAKYNGDYIFATKCVVVTTIVSLLTIPVWCMII